MNNFNREKNQLQPHEGTSSNLHSKTSFSISLQDALDIFFQDESIEDFKCDKCGNNKDDIVIHRKFYRLPRILILHLKRYDHLIKREEKLSTKTSNEKNKDSNINLTSGTSTGNGNTSDSKINETMTSTITKKNASFIKIPRYLTLQFLITDESILKLPKKIPKNVSMTTPCKNDSEKIKIDENSISAQKLPLKDNSINIDYKTYSREIKDVLSPLNGQPIQSDKNSNITTRIPLSSANLNQQKLNNKNTSINLTMNKVNNSNTRSPFSKMNTIVISESQTDLSLTKELKSASQELPLVESNPKESNTVTLLDFEKYDPSNYTISDISEDEQLKLAMQLSLKDPVQNQPRHFALSQELRRKTPSPLPQLDGNSDESKSFSEPDIVEVGVILNEGKANQNMLHDENLAINNANISSKLNYAISYY